MPIYEYRCRKCEKIFEKYVKVTDGGESVTCPSCGGKKPERILSSFSSSKSSEGSGASSCGPSSSKFT
jgi:putative FmdB family regulatory protein